MGDVDGAVDTVIEKPSCRVAPVLAQFDELDTDVEHRIQQPTDEQYTATADQFVLPDPNASVIAVDSGMECGPATVQRLPSKPFLLRGALNAEDQSGVAARASVRFDGPATLRSTATATSVTLHESTTVTIGVESGVTPSPERIQIPETLRGIAAGISWMSAAHRTSTPSRSRPEQRRHPPLLVFGDELAVPASVRDRRVDTGIELRVPESVSELIVGAPLAFYLGADVIVEQRDTTLMTAKGTTIRREFERMPQFQESIADVLSRVFYLDCLVRRGGPEREPSDLLATLELDANTLRTLSPAGRLERYLEPGAVAVRRALPDWHLSTHVNPSRERARCLPYLLDKLSLIYIADGAKMKPKDLLDRTLTDAYPTRGAATMPPAVLPPKLCPGRTQAWMAPGTPIDAFKTTVTAFENRFRYRDRTSDATQITVVCNDDAMTDERGSVTEIYRSGALSMDVTVHERLTRTELASVFEAETDFIHFIGHCDDEGLRCTDGHLSMDALPEPRIRTFFLNACGSYDQGLSLVERGAVAGAVTVADVLDDHAMQVGTAFAKLLRHGFCLQRALELARRRIMMGMDYTVVGDGTVALRADHTRPTVVWLTTTDDGFELSCEVATPQSAGKSYQIPFDDRQTLNGTNRTFSLDEPTLRETLADASVPVIFDGEFVWSDNIVATLDRRE